MKTILSIPIALVLVYFVIQGLLHWYLLILLGGAYLGGLGNLVALVVLWPLGATPVALIWMLLQSTRSKGKEFEAMPVAGFIFTLVLLALLTGAGLAIFYGDDQLITYAADHNCVKALEAGVTGSRPC